MAQKLITAKMLPETLALLRIVSAISREDMYLILDRLVKAEYKRVHKKLPTGG